MKTATRQLREGNLNFKFSNIIKDQKVLEKLCFPNPIHRIPVSSNLCLHMGHLVLRNIRFHLAKQHIHWWCYVITSENMRLQTTFSFNAVIANLQESNKEIPRSKVQVSFLPFKYREFAYLFIVIYASWKFTNSVQLWRRPRIDIITKLKSTI